MSWDCLLPAIAGDRAYSSDLGLVPTLSICPCVPESTSARGQLKMPREGSRPPQVANRGTTDIAHHPSHRGIAKNPERAQLADETQNAQKAVWACVGRAERRVWKNISGVASASARKWPSSGVKDEQGWGAQGRQRRQPRHILYILQPPAHGAASGCAARHPARLVFRCPHTR